VRPVDVTRSDWLCTIEKEPTKAGESHKSLVLRLGLKHVKGLSEATGRAIEAERKKSPFAGIDDLHERVSQLRKDELRKLAAVGALNFIQPAQRSETTSTSPAGTNRRDALWQIARVVRQAGPLFNELHEADGGSPLQPMTLPERMDADFRGTGLTIGRHPVSLYRSELRGMGVSRAIDISDMRNGKPVRVAGWVIVRQRPGTAKGFFFLTLEDETGVVNVIVTPQLFDKNRLVLVDHPFLLIAGALQHQDNVISVKARHVRPLSFQITAAPSHDFH
jgi:error-prone DNA polymerase